MPTCSSSRVDPTQRPAWARSPSPTAARDTLSTLRVVTSTDTVPFHRPHATGRELSNVEQALRSGHLAGDGEWTARCQELLVQLTGARHALLTGSCTHALEMCALLLVLRPGDEIIVPSFTFVSTVNGFVLRGAVPVFVDVRPDTMNLDERLVAEAITPRTKAIVVMHYA